MLRPWTMNMPNPLIGHHALDSRFCDMSYSEYLCCFIMYAIIMWRLCVRLMFQMRMNPLFCLTFSLFVFVNLVKSSLILYSIWYTCLIIVNIFNVILCCCYEKNCIFSSLHVLYTITICHVSTLPHT